MSCCLFRQRDEIPKQTEPAHRGIPSTAMSWKAGRFTGTDGSPATRWDVALPRLRARSGQHEHRRARRWQPGEQVYGASIRSCRPWTDAGSNANGAGVQRPNQRPRQCPSPSPSSGIGSTAVAGLEPTTSTAGLFALASSTPGYPERASPSCSRASLLLPRSLGHSGRIPVCHGRSDWRGPARATTAGRLTFKLFGILETFANWLGQTGA